MGIIFFIKFSIFIDFHPATYGSQKKGILKRKRLLSELVFTGEFLPIFFFHHALHPAVRCKLNQDSQTDNILGIPDRCTEKNNYAVKFN